MKFRFSALGPVVGLVVIGLVAYGLNERGMDLMRALKAWFPGDGPAVEAPKAAAPLTPLATQIPVCRKERSGFQSCMFAAGYAVNADWKAAHDKDSAAATTGNFGRAQDVVNDPFRPGPSPTYGVPYWVPRQP